MNVKLTIPAGIEAATAPGEYHVKNTRSVNCRTDHDAVLKIRGAAVTRSSLYPPSLLHKLLKNLRINTPD